MAEFLASPWASIVFLLALTAMLVAVGVYVIGKVRAGSATGESRFERISDEFQGNARSG